MSETVLVIGAGIGGLCTALALGTSGRTITMVERDTSPPSGSPDDAFREWKRTGVGQLRQSHAFLARLRTILKKDHPGLLQALADAGVRELPFEGMLTDLQRDAYRPEPGDSDLTILTSRRTTLELVMRRYVEAMPAITIRSGVFVRRLITARGEDGVLDVRGLEGDGSDGPVSLHADIVVDASGKDGGTIEQLMADGAAISEASESAGVLYYTRHYRVRPGQSEPSRSGNPPAAGDMGYIKFGVFPADNGCFSITLCVPEIEIELRKAIVNPAVFHAITQHIPGLAVWTDEARAEPTSKVFGMGNLHSRWRSLVTNGVPAVRGYFPIGDTLVRTNPLYGRGCSFAAVSAWLLRNSLEASSDPAARALHFAEAVQRELQPYFDLMRKQDRDAIRRARRALMVDYKPTLRSRLMKSFAEDAVTVAVRSDVGLMREAMRGFHMLEHPDAWLKRPGNMVKVLGYWARGRRANAAAYPPKLGPDRDAMMALLGLDAAADRALVAEARLAA